MPKIVANGDSIEVNGIYSFLNYTYYNETLSGLTQYDGFAPRSFWPSVSLKTKQANTTNLLLIVDCAYEQKIGMAPYFNPYILGDYEIMLNEGTMSYLGLNVGDMVNFTISLASSTT